MELPGVGADDWVKVNMRHTTPMRVIYESPEDMKLLSAAIKCVCLVLLVWSRLGCS